MNTVISNETETEITWVPCSREVYERYKEQEANKNQPKEYTTEHSTKFPAIAKQINKIILTMTQKKGKVPSYATVNRFINKNSISFGTIEVKPIIMEQISIMQRKYIPHLQFAIYLRTTLGRLGIPVPSINMNVLDRMVADWTWMIFNNEGYVSREALFRKVGGDKNVLFYYYKILLEAKWFAVKDEPFYNPADRSCSLCTRYWLGSGHIYYSQEPERNLNAWQKI